MPYSRKLPMPRRHRDAYGHLIIDGYTFMGRPRVPPMPARIALKDRTTGEFKVLSHAAGAGSFVLVDIDPKWVDVQKFGPYEGPYSGNYRLYLDNSVLAFELAAGFNSPKILTRRAYDKTVLEITADTNGAVVYTVYQL